MASTNKRERHFVYLDTAEQSGYGWKYIDQYRKIHQLKNRSAAIEALIREHQLMKNQLLGDQLLVENLNQSLKALIDPIRLRTGAIDRNVSMFKELLNGFLVLHGMEEQFPVVEVQSDAITSAEEKVRAEIKAKQVLRNSQQYQRGGDHG